MHTRICVCWKNKQTNSCFKFEIRNHRTSYFDHFKNDEFCLTALMLHQILKMPFHGHANSNAYYYMEPELLTYIHMSLWEEVMWMYKFLLFFKSHRTRFGSEIIKTSTKYSNKICGRCKKTWHTTKIHIRTDNLVFYTKIVDISSMWTILLTLWLSSCTE